MNATAMTEPACSCNGCNGSLRTGTVLQALTAGHTVCVPEPQGWDKRRKLWESKPYAPGIAHTLPVGLILEADLSPAARNTLRQYPALRRLLQKARAWRYRAAAFRYIYRHLRDVKRVRPVNLAHFKAKAETAEAVAEAYFESCRVLSKALGTGLSDDLFSSGGAYFSTIRLARHDGHIAANLWYDRKREAIPA